MEFGESTYRRQVRGEGACVSAPQTRLGSTYRGMKPSRRDVRISQASSDEHNRLGSY